MNNRLTLAALAIAFAVVSFNCGAPVSKTDAGSGGGTATGGGGGGGGGDGGATGGGTGARTCTAAPAFTAADLNGKAGFNPGNMNTPPFNFATMVRASATSGRQDGMLNEYFLDGPRANVAIPAKNYAMCDYCFYLELACDNTGACNKSYLAQSGTVSIGEATKNPDAGTYTFTLTNVTYEEWDFTNDVAVDGGCLTLGNFSFTGTWP